MRSRESDTERLVWAIPAKIKKAEEPYIYEGTFKNYSDRFEFWYQNGGTPHTFKIPLIEHKEGKTYMKFEGYYGQQFVVFFEAHDLNLAMIDFF